MNKDIESFAEDLRIQLELLSDEDFEYIVRCFDKYVLERRNDESRGSG